MAKTKQEMIEETIKKAPQKKKKSK